MSYLVFARKYRPQTFEDVVAQKHVTRTLQNAVKNDRVGSGYLFCGPRGTGKTTTARILAKAINCQNGPTPVPCGECDACHEIATGTSMDVLEIDAASNTGVDDIRTLRENVRYLPASGQKRIYIIDEVHRLSGAAFDALLKTLEEPPEHVLFIFATTEPGKVPETILSRTQRYDFKRVSATDLAGHLKNIADKEKLDITEEALATLARKADGSVRDSLSLMDQIAAFASEKIDQQMVIEALGLVDQQLLMDFTTAIASHDIKKTLSLVKTVIDGGTDIKDFVVEFLEHLRCLMVVRATGGGEYLEITGDELTAISEQANYFKVGDLVRMTKISGDLLRDLKQSGLDQRLLIEVTAIRMAEMESTIKLEEVLGYVMNGLPESPPNNGSLFGPPSKKKTEPQSKTSTDIKRPPETPPAPAAPVSTRAINLPTLELGWTKFIAFLKQKNVMLASQIAMATVKAVDKNHITAVFATSASAARQVVERADNLKLITDCLKEQFGANLSIKFDLDKNHKPTPTPIDKNDRGVDVAELVKNSDRLQMLIDKVDGEIIGVGKRK